MEQQINWADLSPELTSSILIKLDVKDILQNAQRVCRSWRHVCKHPSMWKRIKMHNHNKLRDRDSEYGLERMCYHAVDLSQGGLLSIDISYFATNHLLLYIAQRSSNLRSLKLVKCNAITEGGFVEEVVRLPLLEELEVSSEIPYYDLSGECMKLVGRSCRNLKTLKRNNYGNWVLFPLSDNDADALAIAETMPGLRHLQLLGNRLSDFGLKALLDNCLHLESLDLCRSWNVGFDGGLEKRCLERIKDFKGPFDSAVDYFMDTRSVEDRDGEEEEENDYFMDTSSVEDRDGEEEEENGYLSKSDDDFEYVLRDMFGDDENDDQSDMDNSFYD